MSPLKCRDEYATLALWLAWGWVTMTVTHELGHVICGLLGGARLVDLQLQPWHLPHSLFAGDAHPLATLWSGFLVGSGVPLLVARAIRRPGCWFVAWFCVLANGVYLLLGLFSGDGELDSTKMIRAGSHPSLLLVAGSAMSIVGYLKFRQTSINLLSGATPAMRRREMKFWAAALALALIFQSAAATAVQWSL